MDKGSATGKARDAYRRRPTEKAVARRRSRGRPALDSAAQREKILAVATSLFVARGFSGTTLDAVGEGAGVTKRTIYQHVGNKEELFRAVCKERLPVADELAFEVRIDDRSLSSIVMAMARELLRHNFSADAIALERTLTIESLRFPRLVQEVIENGMREVNRNIADVLGRLAERDGLPPMDLHRAADFFYDVVIGNRLFRMTMGHVEPLADDAELAERVRMFVEGHLLRPSNGEGGRR